MKEQLISGSWKGILQDLMKQWGQARTFYIIDQNLKHLLPVEELTPHYLIAAEESLKTLATAQQIWNSMGNARLNRKGLVVNIGGGLTTDMGAFVSSTYMRGLDFVHIPTSVLGMVDASIGGKTGINFRGFKNRIGTFQHARTVILDTDLLSSLPEKEWWSGYAEAIKHVLIAAPQLWPLCTKIQDFKDLKTLLPGMLQEISQVKIAIVEIDFREEGERKKLNFGHTIGHALESYFVHLGEEIPHGYAVAAGMWMETELSTLMGLLDKASKDKIQQHLDQWFDKLPFGKSEIPSLIEWMQGDKKNSASGINFTLLTQIGEACIDQYPSIKTIEQALESYVKG